jgi:hypothetical protein
MRDPLTFEARLSDAFESYAAGAPTVIDAGALAAGLARRPQARRRPWPAIPWSTSRVWRLGIVAALLTLAGVAGLLAAGAWLDREPIPPASGGRILIWTPTSVNHGIATLLDRGGTVLASRELDSRGCPSLVGGTDLMAVPGFGTLSLEAVDGRPIDAKIGALSTNYAGFERWSPDRRSIALVDMAGPITVARLDPSAPDAGTTRYGLDGRISGVLEASFSGDGSRLAMARPGDPGQLDVHVLEDGGDTFVRSIDYAGDEAINLAMSPDGGRVAVTVWAEGRPGRLTIIDVVDGTMTVPASPEPRSLDPVMPVSWSADGNALAVRFGARVSLYEAGPGSLSDEVHDRWAVTSFFPVGDVVEARWTSRLLRFALIDRVGDARGVPSSQLIAHAPDVGTDKQVQLPGTDGAFSPDGTEVATVGGVDDAPYEPGGPATIWAFDVWGDREPQVIATLPAPDIPTGPATAPVTCIDWLPGGGS